MNLAFRVGVLLLLAFCGCASHSKSLKARQELLATDRSFSDMSQTRGAAEAFYYFMATNGTSLPAGDQPVRGREAIRASLSSASGVLRWHPVEAEVAASSDLGYTWGLYEYESKDSSGHPKVSHGKYVTVWKRQGDATWKALLDCGNQNPPP